MNFRNTDRIEPKLVTQKWGRPEQLCDHVRCDHWSIPEIRSTPNSKWSSLRNSQEGFWGPVLDAPVHPRTGKLQAVINLQAVRFGKFLVNLETFSKATLK